MVVTDATIVMSATVTTETTKATKATDATSAIVALSYVDCKVIFPSSQVLVHQVQQLQQTKHVQLFQLV